MPKLFKKVLFILILLLLMSNLLFQIYKNWVAYTTPFNPKVLAKIYQYSQFAPNPLDRKLIIEDNDLFAYSGYLYLRGTPPSEIQIEHPPLSKYFFGISILFFSSPNVIQIFFGLGLLLMIYLIGEKIFKDKLLALLPPLLLSFDATFQQQFALSFLDLSHVFFISGAVFFYLKAAENKRYYLLTSLFLGATLLSKYIGFVIIPLLFIYTLVKRRQDFRFFSYTLVFVPIVYFLNYISLFLKGNFFANFLNLHLAILHLYRSYVPEYPWGEIWRLLATGQWRVWFGENTFISVPEWNILWPLTLASLVVMLFLIWREKNEALVITTFFAFFYLLTNSFHLIFPRHLLAFLPFGYILLVFTTDLFLSKVVRAVKL